MDTVVLLTWAWAPYFRISHGYQRTLEGASISNIFREDRELCKWSVWPLRNNFFPFDYLLGLAVRFLTFLFIPSDIAMVSSSGNSISETVLGWLRDDNRTWSRIQFCCPLLAGPVIIWQSFIKHMNFTSPSNILLTGQSFRQDKYHQLYTHITVVALFNECVFIWRLILDFDCIVVQIVQVIVGKFLLLGVS